MGNKRAASPILGSNPRKMPRSKAVNIDPTTAAESEAIAVLEHFRTAGEFVVLAIPA